MTDRRFFYTDLTFRVLSEGEPYTYENLGQLGYDVMEGPNVGYQLTEETHEVPAKKMAHLLNEAGSEPGFFELDEDD